MKSLLLFCAAIFSASPATAAPPVPQIAESKLAHSTVSVSVDPQLNDGRLVIRIAAQNGTSAPVAFGPGSVSIRKVAGQPIALSSLQQLINDVRIAAGMKVDAAPRNSPTAGAYAAPQMQVDSSGHPDVSNYTGSSGIAAAEIVQQSRARPRSLDRSAAETQIAALKQAILQDTTIAPGQIAVGQVVSDKLKLAKGEERIVHIVVHLAGDEHGFTVAAPAE